MLHELQGHTASVLSTAFTPDDRMLTTGSVDGSVCLWDVDSGEPQAILAEDADFVYDVAISIAGRFTLTQSPG